MAGKVGKIEDNGMATGTAAKTLLQAIAAANHGIDVIEIGIGFHGVNNTHEPILVQLVRQSDAGIGGDAETAVGMNDSDGDTFDTTGLSDIDGGEPTGTTIVWSHPVHPQLGIIYSCSDYPIHVGAADRLGLRVTAANGVNADAYMKFVE